MAHLALQGDLLYMPMSFYSYKYIGSCKKSRFYDNKSKKEFWWLPRNVISVCSKIILYLYNCASEDYVEEFIIRRFSDGLYRATFSYRRNVSDFNEMKHYGQKVKKVSKAELISINIKCYYTFIYFLNRLCLKRKREIRRELNHISINNMIDIVKN